MILAGDIGGTNTRLAIFDHKLRLVGKPMKFPTGDGGQLLTHVRRVLDRHKGEPVERATLAVAGPVIDGVANATNIGRKFHEAEIRKAVGIDRLVLINDLVANAAGISRLSQSELVTLQRGEKHEGNCAIVSPGTGLGEGALIWDGRFHRPIASEGGHAHFAPTSRIEWELVEFMLGSQATVSYEDVCSGRGIGKLFDFFVSRGEAVSDALSRQLQKQGDRSRGGLISKAAMTPDRDSPAAIKAMDLFVRILGSECANMALNVFATGGVYLGGGIPPKILPLLKRPTFRKAMLHHRILGDLLKSIPVRVILNDDTALEGAAVYGMRFT